MTLSHLQPMRQEMRELKLRLATRMLAQRLRKS